ncbi:MAG: glycosyltransferase, partial [Candidatus Binatia bacterium]
MWSDLDTHPEVSVIIVTHNSTRCLGSCLTALRKQGVVMQLIIVDNASLPTEAPILDDNENGELILNTRNKGFAPAVNQGLERARAPYVLLLNPDVYLEPGALRLLLTFLEANPQRAAASPRMWWDAEHTALLPLTAVPSLALLVARVVAGRLQIARTLLGRWWIASRKRLWFAQEPFAVPAIAGGCVLIAKSVL